MNVPSLSALLPDLLLTVEQHQEQVVELQGYGYIDRIELLTQRDHSQMRDLIIMKVKRIYEGVQKEFCPGCPLEAVLEAKKKAGQTCNGSPTQSCSTTSS